MFTKLYLNQFLRLPIEVVRSRHLSSVINERLACHRFKCQNLVTCCSYNNCQRYCVRSHTSEPRKQKAVISPSLNTNLPSDKYKYIQLWRERIDPYAKLVRMDRPIGTWLLFWPCSWSIALASIEQGLAIDEMMYYLGLFYFGSFVMRGAGCTINDLWDRDVDSKVERTKCRPLVSGAISERQALVFLSAQLSVGLAVLMQLNWLSVAVGASSMFLVVSYPLAKRITDYPQMFLGATFNWGAILGYTAVANVFDPNIILPMYFGALCWTVLYDTIYAHQDKNDDRRIGIKSTALKFGPNTKKYLSIWSCVSLTSFLTLGLNANMDLPYYIALSVATAHVGRQIYTLDTENPEDCSSKFKSNSYVGLIMLLGILGGGYKRYMERLALNKS